jgi:hypothetical protein
VGVGREPSSSLLMDSMAGRPAASSHAHPCLRYDYESRHVYLGFSDFVVACSCEIIKESWDDLSVRVRGMG